MYHVHICRLVQQLKDSPMRSTLTYQIQTKISMASDAIQVRKCIKLKAACTY